MVPFRYELFLEGMMHLVESGVIPLARELMTLLKEF